MKRIIPLILLILIAAFSLSAEIVLDGKLIVPVAGFQGFEFQHSYIYVVELDEYFPVQADGTFTAQFDESGAFTLQPRCPGFQSPPVLVRVPYNGVFPLELQLQVIEITIRVVQEIPEYIITLKNTLESLGANEQEISENEYNRRLSESLSEERKPIIDFGAIFRFIRERAEKRRNKR